MAGCSMRSLASCWCEEHVLVDGVGVFSVAEAQEEVGEVDSSGSFRVGRHVLFGRFWDGDLGWPFWVGRHGGNDCGFWRDADASISKML